MFDNAESLIKKRDHLNTLIEKKIRDDSQSQNKSARRKIALLSWLGITMVIDKKTRQGVLNSISEYMPSEDDKSLFRENRSRETTTITAAADSKG